jgi:eukaryotic-like serine/threonine-protein kinase
LGGGWADPDYMFGQADAVTPFDRSRATGFRCIKLIAGAAATLDDEVVPQFSYWAKEKPVGDDLFQAYRGLFAYEKTPLESRIENVVEDDPRWRVERVTFNAAYNNERVPAWVILPRNAAPPYQTVIWFPGTGAVINNSSERIPEQERLAIYTTSGRAVVYPIYKGTHERKEPWQIPLGPGYVTPVSTVAYRDSVLQWSKDFSRTVDYLETRSDIRHDKLAYVGFSWGAMVSSVILAVDQRPKVAILWSGGLFGGSLPEVNQYNFAPRVTIPVLMLNGRFDYTFPVESSQRPLLQLLGSAPEDKSHILFEALHPLTPNQGGKESVEWLDRYLGPAR